MNVGEIVCSLSDFDDGHNVGQSYVAATRTYMPRCPVKTPLTVSQYRHGCGCG